MSTRMQSFKPGLQRRRCLQELARGCQVESPISPPPPHQKEVELELTVYTRALKYQTRFARWTKTITFDLIDK